MRRTADWRKLWGALGLQKDERRSRENDWWGKSPLHPGEKTASFHLNAEGWYCFATGKGGGVIELVQETQRIDCYAAARWLLEHGVSFLVGETRDQVASAISPTAEPLVIPAAEEPCAPEPNQPIRTDLRKLLRTDHSEFARRGIPSSVLAELGAGFLPADVRKRRDGLSDRLVFQVRGVEERAGGELRSVILTHMGRATTTEQETSAGKWWTYPGFRKSLELYNLNGLLLDPDAIAQAQLTERVLIVEGCFDVAKLLAAEIRNVVATFGAHMSEDQLPRLRLIAETTGVSRFHLFYDRDAAGREGSARAKALLDGAGFEASEFDWERKFLSGSRGAVGIPEEIGDPAELSVAQIAWLRASAYV